MSRKVLLVEPDIDVLGDLASRLRSVGLTVGLADNAGGAVEQARSLGPDAILLSDALVKSSDVVARLASQKELAMVPRFILVSEESGGSTGEFQELRYSDPAGIAKKLLALAPKGESVVPASEDFRGDLKQVSMADLLQLLAMNARTGTLSINTVSGAGEVRLVGGEVADAVYRRMEGEKALYRLFAESEGSFAFATSQGTVHRRIQVPTNVLLMEGMRQVDEVRRKRTQIADGDDALLSIVPPTTDADEVSQMVSDSLSVPHTLDELLEDLPYSDVQILDTLNQLVRSGAVRKVPRGALQVELAQRERFGVLSALVKKLQRAGFVGAARIAVLAPPQRITALMHSVQRIVDAIVPTESVPTAPVPYLLATLRLAEGVELEVVGLPALDAFEPLWALTLPGCALVLTLDYSASAPVQALCGVLGVPFLEAVAVLGELDEADPSQVAALISGALELATGD
jgi:hypothetical protein